MVGESYAQEYQSETNSSQTASFSPFKAEALRLVKIKEEYEHILRTANFNNNIDRELIVRQAHTLYSALSFILLDGERFALEQVLNGMSTLQLYVRMAQSLESAGALTSQFESKAYNFLTRFVEYQNNHGLGIKTKDKQEQITLLTRIFQVPNMKLNRYDIPISLEMDMFCELLKMRQRAKWDNLFVIEGVEGVGKSSFTLAAETTLSEKNNIKFSLNRNFTFKEDREYVTKLLKSAYQYESFALDEAGNQLGNKSWWANDQKELVNLLRYIRFHNLTMMITWPKADELDLTLRGSRAQFVITIAERGVAYLRVYNKNPAVTKRTSQFTANQRKENILTPDAVSQFLSENDSLNVLRIPFYEIPANIWALYEKRKETAFTAAKLNILGTSTGHVTTLQQEAMVSVLKQIPDDAVAITSAELKRIALSADLPYKITTKDLARHFHSVTGEKERDILVVDPLNPMEGEVRITDYINTYIKRLKAQRENSVV